MAHQPDRTPPSVSPTTAAPTRMSHRLRARRFRLFERLVERLPRPLRIIDIGGTNEYWEQRGWAGRDDVTITLVNLDGRAAAAREHPPDRGRRDRPGRVRRRRASTSRSRTRSSSTSSRSRARPRWPREVRRVAPRLLGADAELLVPDRAALPRARLALAARGHARGDPAAPRRRLGGPLPDPENARAVVQEHRLMRRSELARAVPRARRSSASASAASSSPGPRSAASPRARRSA